MAPLHSLVDDLGMKNRCRQKEGVTLRPSYLIGVHKVVIVHPWYLVTLWSEETCNIYVASLTLIGCSIENLYHVYYTW